MESTVEPRVAPAVDVRQLTRRCGKMTAVDHVTLAVPSVQIHGLLSSNGAGKTTLIKMLTTLLPPTEGDALIAGVSILSALAEVRRQDVYVPQMLSADGALTWRENLVFSARLYGIPSGDLLLLGSTDDDDTFLASTSC